MKITLFITCFNDTLFPETGKAVVYLLERLGHTVEFPLEQTCCGQMHYNTGYQEEAIVFNYRETLKNELNSTVNTLLSTYCLVIRLNSLAYRPLG